VAVTTRASLDGASSWWNNRFHRFVLLATILLSPAMGYVGVAIIAGAATLAMPWWGRSLSRIVSVGSWQVAAIISAAFLLLIILEDWFQPGDRPSWYSIRMALPLLVPFLLVHRIEMMRVQPLQLARRCSTAMGLIAVAAIIEWVIRRHMLGLHGLSLMGVGHPLLISAMLVPIVLLSWIEFERRHPWERWLLIGETALAIVAIVAPLDARASLLIVLALMPLAYIAFSGRGLGDVRQWLRVGGLSALLIGALAVAVFVIRPEAATSLRALVVAAETGDLRADSNMHTRMEMWEAGWHAVGDAPWVGYGFENEPSAVAPWLPATEQTLPTVHQQYLSFALGGGVIGVVVGVSFLLLPIIAAGVARLPSLGVKACLALTIPFVLNGVTDTLFDDMRILFYYVTMTILLLSINWQSTAGRRQELAS
jgi:hypothetical protein